MCFVFGQPTWHAKNNALILTINVQNKWRARDDISPICLSPGVVWMKSSGQPVLTTGDWSKVTANFANIFSISKPSLKKSYGVTPSSSLVQQSNHAIWIHVFTTVTWIVFEISKDVLDLFCSPCHKRFYSFWSLFFKFPWLTSCNNWCTSYRLLCEAGFLQVMVHDNIDTSDYCAFGTFRPRAFSPSLIGAIFIQSLSKLWRYTGQSL